jgi:hypothetical protein
MMRTPLRRIAVFLTIVYAAALVAALRAQQPASDGPRYANGTNLMRPADYREWIYLSSGMGMTYKDGAAGSTTFSNAFVNPSSYRAFMQTGQWPDKTIFVLEFRNSDSEKFINRSGRFQTELSGVEAEVKDARFPDGWAYFQFKSGAASAAPLAGSTVTECIDCHTKNTAVEHTFVQFYPTLLDVARAKKTLKPGFR